jgi:hypothetical protein
MRHSVIILPQKVKLKTFLIIPFFPFLNFICFGVGHFLTKVNLVFFEISLKLLIFLYGTI